MKNKLAQKFNVVSLLKFTAPTTIMLVFISLYQMVDAVFVSNFVGENALSALNIAYPVPSIIIAIAIMLATGGSAIVAKNMGEGKTLEAKQNFSLIVATGLAIGLVFSLLGIIFLKPIVRSLGATDILYQYCYDYLLILIVFCPIAILQMLFQTFFVTAGKPHLGLALTVVGGMSNILFDYLFIVEVHMGVKGAAFGTVLGYAIPAVVGVIYFWTQRKGTLYFVKPKLRLPMLVKTCLNGSSEMVTNLAVAVTTFLFNIIMLRYLGESGVAAITIVLYAQFLLTSIFMGFAGGVAPVISYNYGNKNHEQLKRVFRISMMIIGVFSAAMFAVSILLAKPIISVFAKPDSGLFSMTHRGFMIFAVSYLFTGVNIFASSLFTAFSNGKISAAISFLRTFVFLVLCLTVLPLIIGADGIWMSVPVAEFVSLGFSIYFITRYRRQYHY